MTETQQDKTQRELDAIMIKQGLLKDADDRYAKKIIERIVFGILSLFGVAVVMQLIKAIGL